MTRSESSLPLLNWLQTRPCQLLGCPQASSKNLKRYRIWFLRRRLRSYWPSSRRLEIADYT